eukprot:CAMPEP_0184695366 /NCGR_PEP_ID=MMETSP0313-20130426/3020_1 /TAXON_ID=2792 /ORGANISM="Porphyridium aerugineum, Strain SAG 1380-2" /LENGTH=164 /DNA_ID=CAMNT_0027153803 /DNA_START=200 /DNA_END=694 /DNA_ORIENTATION=+
MAFLHCPQVGVLTQTKASSIQSAVSRKPSSGRICRVVMLSPGVKVGKPKTSIQKDLKRVNEPAKEPQADASVGAAKAKPRRKTESEEIPLFKVILLGDEEYDEVHVVTQLVKIVQLQKDEAVRVYGVAQATGSEVICVVNEEQAEFYVQQLKRVEIYAIMEKDE